MQQTPAASLHSGPTPALHFFALLTYVWWCCFWSLFAAGASLTLASFSSLQRSIGAAWWGQPFLSGHMAADAALFLLGFHCSLILFCGGVGGGGASADALRRASSPRALLGGAALALTRLYLPYTLALLPAAVWAEAWTSCRPSFSGGLRWAPWGLLAGSGGPGRPAWCAPPAAGEDSSPAGARLGGALPPRALPPLAYLALAAHGAPLAAQASGAWLWPAAAGLQSVGALGAAAGALALLSGAAASLSRRVGSHGGAARSAAAAALRAAGRRRGAEAALLALLGGAFVWSAALRLFGSPPPSPLPGTAVLYTPRAAEVPLLGGGFTALGARAHAFAAGALAARAALSAGEAGATPAGGRFAAALGALALVAVALWEPSSWYGGGVRGLLLPPLPPRGRAAALALQGPIASLALAAAVAPAARSVSLNRFFSVRCGGALGAGAAAAPLAALLQPALACGLSWLWGGGGEWRGGAPAATPLMLLTGALSAVGAMAFALCSARCARVALARAGCRGATPRGDGGGDGGGASAPPSHAWIAASGSPAAEWPGGRLGPHAAGALPAAAAVLRVGLNLDVGVAPPRSLRRRMLAGASRVGAVDADAPLLLGVRGGSDSDGSADSWEESDSEGSGGADREEGGEETGAGEGVNAVEEERGGFASEGGTSDDGGQPPTPPHAEPVGPGEARLRVVARLLLASLAEEARASAKCAPAVGPASVRQLLAASLAPAGLERITAAAGWGARASAVALAVLRGAPAPVGAAGGGAEDEDEPLGLVLGAVLNHAFRWAERARAPDAALRALAQLATDALADAEDLLLGGGRGAFDAAGVARLLEVAALVLEEEEEARADEGVGTGPAPHGAAEGAV
jgi:hypothetical protein